MKEASNKIISIVIVTRGTKDYLELCLDSLKKQTYPNTEIIVIDNSLNPNFNQEINKRWPVIKLYSSPRNLFYCKALNLGIHMSKGNFLLCLNDDVILDKNFIEEALKGFAIDERIGMVSGKILRTNGRIIDSTGLFLSIWRTAKERGYGLKNGRYEKAGYIFGVNGAVAFYRKEMLEAVKENGDYFDPEFRIFYEDLDIAWRGQNFGWKAYYVPKALAYHVRGGTARLSYGINKPFARRYLSNDLLLDLIKNRYLTIIKNESYLGFLLHLLSILLYEFLSWGFILFFRPVLIKKFTLNFKILKSAFKKRRLIKRRKLFYV